MSYRPPTFVELHATNGDPIVLRVQAIDIIDTMRWAGDVETQVKVRGVERRISVRETPEEIVALMFPPTAIRNAKGKAASNA